MSVRARDDSNLAILLGLHGGAALKLIEGEWRDGTYAEYAKFPTENVFPLNEEILLGKLGYSIEDLCAIPGKTLFRNLAQDFDFDNQSFPSHWVISRKSTSCQKTP